MFELQFPAWYVISLVMYLSCNVKLNPKSQCIGHLLFCTSMFVQWQSYHVGVRC